MNVFFDAESFSEEPISSGTYAYAAKASMLLAGYAVDDGPAQVWDCTRDPMPADFSKLVANPDAAWVAHNAMFDRCILENNGISIPIERWRCDMAKALSMGLPGSLEMLGSAMGLNKEQAKLKDGKKLVNKFCKPAPRNHRVSRYDRHNSPDEWARFIMYCRQDVEALRTLWNRIPDWNYRNGELALWHLDQCINDTGLPVDLDAVVAAIDLIESEKSRLNQELRELTNGELTSTSQVKNTLTYLEGLGV